MTTAARSRPHAAATASSDAPARVRRCDRARRYLSAWRSLVTLAVMLIMPAAMATVGVTLVVSNPTPIAGGAAFSYTATMTNNDQVLPATNVVMTLPLPPGVVFQNLSLVENSPVAPPAGTRGFFSCTTPKIGANGLVECTANSFPASTAMIATTATVTLVVQIVPDVASGVRTATARVAANGVQFTDSDGLNIQVNAPLSITKSAPPTVGVGQSIIYRITVNNGGSSTALNATISDPLPPGTSFVSMFGTGPFHDGCHYAPGTNAVVCQSVDIPSGVSALTVVLETSSTIAPGPLSNTATITTAGTGSISVGSAMVSSTVVVTVPDPPTGVAAYAGSGQATVSFSPPQNDGGAPIDGYTVTCTPTIGMAVSASGLGSPITVGGLTNGLTYSCTVHATNSEGDSVESEPSNPVTPTAGSPQTLTVTIAGSGSGFVASNPPGIGCLADCSEAYPAGTGVELSAGATGTSIFTGWLGGGCTGTGPCIVTMNAAQSVTATFAPQGFVPTLDVDASAPGTKYDALTDGLLVLRYLFGLTGSALTSNAIGATATRGNADIPIYLNNIRPMLDVDGNSQTDALTDGLVVIRRLFGFTGAPLIQNAIGQGASRQTAPAIENYMQQLTPP